MSRYAEGMEDAIARAETFGDDDEAAAFWAEGAPDVPVEDVTYAAATGPRAARWYRGGGRGVVLYIHGGGWVGGNIALNERCCRTLASVSGWDVLSVSYRLAPEHPFPAGLDDCRAALRAMSGRPLAIAGTSAGANLAIAAALAERDVPLDGMVLFYGVFGDDLDTASYRAHASGFGLTRDRCREIFDLYDPGAANRDNPLLVPLKGDLAGLPPTCLIAAELDVLADDSGQMAKRLAAAGVPAELHVEPGVTHGFINRGRLVPAATSCLNRAAGFLTRLAVTEPAK